MIWLTVMKYICVPDIQEHVPQKSCPIFFDCEITQFNLSPLLIAMSTMTVTLQRHLSSALDFGWVHITFSV